MSSKEPVELGLKKSYDELLMTAQGRAENRLSKIYEVPLSEIDEFPDHPYQVRLDEDMDQLVASVKERGIITPVILRRKEDGRYEMVSGHRRMKACELAGLETIKADIQDLNRDEAILLMVESNLQRSVILPSEKAKAYKMKLEVVKRQGSRSDLTSTPLAGKLRRSESADIVGALSGDSGDQVRRYIRLNELIPNLLDIVDEGRIGLRPAVELSYLQPDEQEILLDYINQEETTPSLSQALKLKQYSQEGRLTEELIEAIIAELKPNQVTKYTFRGETLWKYIPKYASQKDAEKYVIKALEYYSRYREQQRRREDEHYR